MSSRGGRYRLTFYWQPGDLGEGGMATSPRGRFSTAERAEEAALRWWRSYDAKPNRVMISRPGEHPLWLRLLPSGDVERFQHPESMPLELWGYIGA